MEPLVEVNHLHQPKVRNKSLLSRILFPVILTFDNSLEQSYLFLHGSYLMTDTAYAHGEHYE